MPFLTADLLSAETRQDKMTYLTQLSFTRYVGWVYIHVATKHSTAKE